MARQGIQMAVLLAFLLLVIPGCGGDDDNRLILPIFHFSIPYKNILDLEYGQKAGRRVGVAIGTA